MLAFSQDRKKRYTQKVFAKITEDQNKWLERKSDRQNISVSELVRDAIQRTIDAESAKSGDGQMQLCLELLQAIRSEALTIGASLIPGLNVKQLAAESEQVAPHELEQLKERRARRMDLMKALGEEV